jgi:hypothetical protein
MHLQGFDKKTCILGMDHQSCQYFQNTVPDFFPEIFKAVLKATDVFLHNFIHVIGREY